MSTRLRKQFVYGTFYVLLLAVGLYILISPWLPRTASRAIPTPSPTVTIQPIVVEQVNTVSHGNSVDVAVRLKNPNPRLGVAQYPVTIVLKDQQGFSVGSGTETTYLLPGVVQYVAAVSVPTSAAFSQVAVEVPPSPQFIAVPDSWTLPSFNSFFKEQSIKTTGTQRVEDYVGVVSNASSLDWVTVNVVGIAFDAQGQVVGIGKTFVGSLKAGEQREFRLQWPAPVAATVRVSVLPSTNIFSAANTLPIIGDPGSLR